MGSHRTNTVAVVSLAVALLFLALPSLARAEVVDFSGFPAGTVLAGVAPAGPVAGTLIAGFTMSGVNAGGGPDALVVFDSGAPTGDDSDLGTPNADFGGPGLGLGGGQGQPGANDRALGNLVIVAEHIADDNGDGRVDAPDDEAGGGTLAFDFDELVTIERVVLVDIDADETASVRLYRGEVLAVEISAAALGNNSVQTLLSGFYPAVSRMEIVFSSSGALAEFEYAPQPTPVETTSWGAVKATYSD
ncbi:MAG: hypothetical protein OEO21_03825 [Candidatus Krumholzibacteria bacterium]|nr:hypothetical protein [Candidatus Krumholzibacteria bacterium]